MCPRRLTPWNCIEQVLLSAGFCCVCPNERQQREKISRGVEGKIVGAFLFHFLLGCTLHEYSRSRDPLLMAPTVKEKMIPSDTVKDYKEDFIQWGRDYYNGACIKGEK